MLVFPPRADELALAAGACLSFVSVVGLLKTVSDIEDRGTLRDGNQNGINVPAADAVVYIRGRLGMVEPVGARLQCPVFPEAHEVKCHLASDDACLRQLAADPHGRGTGRNLHQGFGSGPERREDQPSRRAPGQQQEEQDG